LVMGALALALMAAPAGAISIVDPSGIFFGFSQSDVNNDNVPFWDGNSSDSGANDYNIGHYILGYDPDVGGPINPGPGVGFATPQYYGLNTDATGYDTSFYFMDGDTTVTLKLEIAGYAGSNEFGWYEYNPTTKTLGNKHVIFTGSATPGEETTISFTTYFVFYLKSLEGEFTTLTGGSHFAIFRDGSDTMAPFVWYIGMEDLATLGDKDYQDMVVSLQFDTGGGVVPIPGSVLLLGSGLLGLLAMGRRRNKRL